MDSDAAADRAAARCSFQLTYGRAGDRREFFPDGIGGPSIDDAFRPGQSSPGEWCGDSGHKEYDVDGWIDVYASYALNEAVHEALEWFQVDGKPWLSPHGKHEERIYQRVGKLAAELADLRRELVEEDAVKRGTCPVCDRSMSLTKAGVLRHHASDLWVAGRRQYRCDGAGQKPKED